MRGAEYVSLRGSQSDEDEERGRRQGEAAAPRRPSGLAARLATVLGLLGAVFLAGSLVLSLLPASTFPAPSYPFHTALPSEQADEYGREHGLLSTFDRESWTMSEAQCDAAFHPLWTPLYESMAHLQSKGGHTSRLQDDIEKQKSKDRELTCVRIVNNTLYLADFHHSNGGSRPESGISLLERALITSTEPLPDVRFCLSTQDQAVDGTFSLTRRKGQESIWLAPDFGFWAWPEPGVGSYVGFRHKARQVEARVGGWAWKKKSLFWRGATWIGEERRVMAEVADKHAWGDVHNIDWGGPKSDGVHPDNWESMEGHCKYAFLASPEGISYSGRLKYLQNCESVIFTRTAEYLQHWTHLYNGNSSSDLQNMVVLPPVDGDITKSWINAAPEMEALLADDARAQRIAARSVEIFRDRFLSPAAVACYWRKAIRVWATTQRFTVALDGSETPWEAFTAQFFKMHIPIS